ncbi:MAG: alpha/beta hydrolase [Chitinophaga sp.]|uniref:alpha/beta fold hydrolase n=1 Tax=Chitinophaga sp. TaxID=1869181 RepID=UPI0025C7413B|nr:alpha/beta hydrolase [Chitinophaga sp.]MBV8252286.1 alpha/beta hydrolase [Chitinophaga sp.]
MKNLFFKIKIAFTLALFAVLLGFNTTQAQQIKNVVLVHGAFADGSGWRALYDILIKKGYHVTVVQNPLSSLEDDVAATKVALDNQDGPVVLVGHSWGGVVITEAGNHPKVAALVYVSAFQPDNGETALQWFQTAKPAPENGVLPPDSKGFVYYDKEKYHAGFCADIPKDLAAFMYSSQGAFAGKCFVTPVTHAAWRDKPTFACIATEDKTITPEIQRAMYKRSNTKTTDVKGSHVIFMSQPLAVAKVIEEASKVTVK